MVMLLVSAEVLLWAKLDDDDDDDALLNIINKGQCYYKYDF